MTSFRTLLRSCSFGVVDTGLHTERFINWNLMPIDQMLHYVGAAKTKMTQRTNTAVRFFFLQSLDFVLLIFFPASR